MTQLVQYDRARAAIKAAMTVEGTLELRDEIEHLKLHAQQIRDRSLMADAAELQMRCERRLGELLIEARRAGVLYDRGRPKAAEKGSGSEPFSEPAKLSEIGVDKKLSTKATQSAGIAAQAFEQLIEAMRERMAAGAAIIVDPVRAHAKDAEIAERRAAHAARVERGGTIDDLHKLIASGYRARAIHIDPPWHFVVRSAAGEARSASVHYTTTQFDKLASLPIGDLAADDCVMFMWTVDWAPQQALDLIAHYGFLHKTTAFTWAKQNESGQDWHMGQGYWTRANPEACWLATRGNPKRLHADVRQLMFHPVTAHSEKPDAVFERIERLVAGPYLDIFARKPRPGWTCWGNEHFSQAMAGQPLAGDSCARDGDSACALEESASISPSGALSAFHGASDAV
jgi:N6-adenosine-specific RNA methylase IME4